EVERRPEAPGPWITDAQQLRVDGNLAAAADAFDTAARLSKDGERWQREARELRAQLSAETGE
ncbi:MAG TPA: hypothetical protein VNL37_01585, partial [Candidatus Polarisedimenticolia bacterium]|nr:hypothetical protein [Candidatus Polarisedimenticolia bacterium]